MTNNLIKIDHKRQILIIGQIGIVIYSHYFEPASNSTEDAEAQEIAMQFSVNK